MDTVFHGGDLPATECFHRWYDMAITAHAPYEVWFEREPTHFSATLGLVDLGNVQVTAFTCPELYSSRTARLIRKSDPELYDLALIHRGRIEVNHHGRADIAGPGDLILSSTSHPLESRLAADDGTITMSNVVVPRGLLPLPAGTAEQLLAVRLSGRDGVGALLTPLISHLTSGTADLGPNGRTFLGGALLDLTTALVADRLDAPHAAPAESRENVMMMRVQSFIRRHLADPGLSPEAVASAHHISVRTLQRLFQRHGTSVAAWIRNLRLDGCRHDLADPAQHHRTVHAIAAHWGFPRPADFTRAFRSTYGLAPSEYRHMTQRS